MQIRAAIIEKPAFCNISATNHDYVTKEVSKPMFSWSRNPTKACKKVTDVYIESLCKLVAAITENPTIYNIFTTTHDNLTKVVSKPTFLWSTNLTKTLKILKNVYI